MSVFFAVLALTAFTAFYITHGSRVAPTITFAKPTTVIPAGSVIFAALVAVTVLTVGILIEASTLWVWIFAVVIGLAILAAAGVTAGNRLVYDRGGYRMAPGKLIGALALFILCFTAIIRVATQNN